jgi:hypothetical protein
MRLEAWGTLSCPLAFLQRARKEAYEMQAKWEKCGASFFSRFAGEDAYQLGLQVAGRLEAGVTGPFFDHCP